MTAATPHPLAGKPAPDSLLLDVPRLIAAYYTQRPDPTNAGQRVAFGTSGHRGSAFDGSFNEAHVLAISQAVCNWRRAHAIDGPLFLGFDTHALSAPAFASVLEVLAANQIETRIAAGDEYTPTPAISHAILCHNLRRERGLADGIVITPSHNPPESGGIKYNPANGGPADSAITGWIEAEANRLLAASLDGVRRVSVAQARSVASTREHDFVSAYVADLAQVLDMELIAGSSLQLGVDPLGGAGLRYWQRIAEHYRLDLSVVNTAIDPTFRFMTVDWDGRIRMDPSSRDAMQGLIGLKDSFDLAFACDPDHDRHGIVVPGSGLLPPNAYLCVAIDHLFRHRPQWSAQAAVGKTLVSSALIDRVTARLGRELFEVPVGFKWFSERLADGSLGFGGEESAGASLLRLDGSVWTTDKDGIALGLLAAEITARSGRDPGELYRQLTAELGEPWSERVDAPASAAQKRALAKLAPAQITQTDLAGDPIVAVQDRAPGNNAAIGGVKISTANGWFAARPSGTESLYKIYAESFRDSTHLQLLLGEAQQIVDGALATVEQ